MVATFGPGRAACGACLALPSRMESPDTRLRYISAAKVQTPVGELLDQIDVLDNDDSSVGKLEGIVVDPAERQVRYYVVKSERPYRHFLLPLVPATIDTAHKAMHVDARQGDLDELEDGPAEAFPAFSDDDLLTALFSSRPH